MHGPPTIGACNDLIEVTSRYLIKEKHFEGQKDVTDMNMTAGSIQMRNLKKMALRFINTLEVKMINIKGVKPMPRQDHCVELISKEKYMIIFGGKND